jgi:hypothetical protein
MRLIGFVAVLAAVMLAGCASGNGDGVARQVARPTPTATPSSKPPFDRDVLSAQTKRVLMAQAALLNVGGPTRAAENLDGDFLLTRLCGAYPNQEGRTGHVAHERVWTTNAFVVSNVAHGYHLKTGVEAVDEARAAAEKCPSFHSNYFTMYTDARADDNDNIGYDLLGVVEFATPGGVEESYGRCMKETYPSGTQRVVCFAYLGRGNLVSVLFVTAGLDEAAGKAKLLQIVPIAAAALVGA